MINKPLIGFCIILLISLSTIGLGEEFTTLAAGDPTPVNAGGDFATLPSFGVTGTEQYSTNLFTGSATYSFPIEVMRGVNGLQPSISLSYNHHTTKAMMNDIGNGWSVSKTYIQRHTNYTSTDTSDDYYILIFNGQQMNLVYDQTDGLYHTQQETFMKIESLASNSNYNGKHFLITTKDGTKYRLGYTTNSELVSNQELYAVRWSLDTIIDTHNNVIDYRYLENPNGETGTVYLDRISYNNDNTVVEFDYNYVLTQRKESYILGNFVKGSGLVVSIKVSHNNALVRRYRISYTELNGLTKIKDITLHGSNDQPALTTRFDYFIPDEGWSSQPIWNLPNEAYFGTNISNGVKLIDVNGDGLPDVTRMFNNDVLEYWLNTGNGWSAKKSQPNVLPGGFADGEGKDNGVVYIDINQDNKLDIVQSMIGLQIAKDVRLNTGTGWTQGNYNLPSEVGLVNEIEKNITFTLEPGYWTNCNPPSCSGGRVTCDIDVDNTNHETERECRKYQCYDRDTGDYVGSCGSCSKCCGSGYDSVKSIRYERCDHPYTPPVTEIRNLKFHLDGGVRLADINGDGEVDIVKGYSGNIRTWIKKGNNWVEDSSWSLPNGIYFIDEYGRDLGIRLVDVNGDGLPDVVKGRDNTKNTWVNTGKEWSYQGSWTLPPDITITSNYESQGVLFTDINSDGLTDIVQAKDDISKVFLNNGQYWEEDTVKWTLPTQISFNNLSTQFVDIDGDLNQDIIYAASASDQNTYTNNLGKAYFLSKITNSYGGNTEIDYTKIYEYDNTGTDNLPDIPFSGWVASSYTINNGITDKHSNQFEVQYTYRDGLFDSETKEFRGFGQVTEQLQDTIINHKFSQDTVLKGLEIETNITNTQGHTLHSSINQYTASDKGGYYVITQDSVEQKTYGSLPDPLITRTELRYDEYNNLINQTYEGDVILDGDEITTLAEYVVNTNDWILNLPSHQTTHTDSKQTESWYSYDNQVQGIPPIKGDLTKQESWLHTGDNIIETFTYNNFGNVIEYINPENKKTIYSYDSKNIYVVEEENPLGHKIQYEYHIPTGNVLSTTDPNNIKTLFVYDVLGRKIKEISPYDSTQYPTSEIIYDLDGIAPEKITIKNRVNPGQPQTIDEISYYDGLGNLIQKKTTSNTDYTTTDYVYDKTNQVILTTNPYISSSQYSDIPQIPSTFYGYDVLGRISNITYPDNTISYNNYDLLNETTIDTNGVRKEYHKNTYGQIIKVIEYNNGETYITSYAYNSFDNIANITDNEGNILVYVYDTLGRKTQVTDPDTGKEVYTYDKLGNILSITDDSGRTTTKTYDELSRILTDSTSSSTITYTYDTDKLGTLSKITTPSTITEFDYDNRYRVISETKDIDGLTFTTSYTYNSQDQPITKTWPDNTQSDYTYDETGKLTQVPGIVNNIDYNLVGLPIITQYPNTITTSYTYDNNNFNLLSINAQNILDIKLDYDTKDNILSKTDSIINTKEEYKYDDLDRLIEDKKTDLNTNTILSNNKFIYDSLGNMISSINDIFGMIYQYYNQHKTSSVDIKYNMSTDISSIPKTTTEVNQVYTYNTQSSLEDLNIARYTLSKSPQGMNIDTKSGKINWLPTTLGNYEVEVLLEKGYLGNETQSFSIRVKLPNTQPNISPIPDQYLAEDSKSFIDLQLYVNDNENDPLTYKVTSEIIETKCLVNGDNLTITPTKDYFGSSNCTIIANDGEADSNKVIIQIIVNSVNDPPVMSGSVFFINEDEQEDISLFTYSYDVDGDPLTYRVIDHETGINCQIQYDRLKMIPNKDLFGRISCKVIASDGIYESNPGTFTLDIQSINDAPIISNIPFISLFEDGSYQTDITPYVSDVEHDPLTFKIVDEDTKKVDCEILGNTIAALPALNYNGQASCSVKANDGQLDSNIARIDMDVIGVNDPPGLSPIPSIQTDEDVSTSLDLTPYASDVDNDPLTFEIVDEDPTKADCSISGNKIHITPYTNYAGPTSCSIRASDGTDFSQSINISIIIGGSNDPPVLSPIPSIQTDEDVSTSLDLTPYASDVENDPLTFEIVEEDITKADCSITNSVLNINPILNYYGQANCSVKVEDPSQASSIQSVSITINSINDAPTVQTPTLTSSTNNGNIELECTGNYEDIENDPLTSLYRFTDNGKIVQSYSSNNKYDCVSNCIGQDILCEFKVNDGQVDSVSKQSNIYHPSNTPPKITSIPTITADEDSVYTYEILTTDAENDPLTYNITQKPQGMILSGNKITWTPNNNHVGTNKVTVKVSDGIDTTTQDFDLNIINTFSGIYTPTLPDAHVNVQYTYDIQADDEGEGTIYAVGIPVGMNFDLGTGIISWIPDSSDKGQLDLQISADDTHGGKDSRTYTINILGSPDLIIDSAMLLTPAKVGQSSLIYFTMKNIGSNDAKDITWTIDYQDGKKFQPDSPTILTGNELSIFEYITFTTPGSHNITILADSNNSIIEESENNNNKTFSIVVT